jgi:DNA polymerase (family 10)
MRDTHARLAGEAGAWVCISSDAHSVRALDFVELGASQARRGWLTAEQVLNTREWAEIERIVA